MQLILIFYILFYILVKTVVLDVPHAAVLLLIAQEVVQLDTISALIALALVVYLLVRPVLED